MIGNTEGHGTELVSKDTNSSGRRNEVSLSLSRQSPIHGNIEGHCIGAMCSVPRHTLLSRQSSTQIVDAGGRIYGLVIIFNFFGQKNYNKS